MTDRANATLNTFEGTFLAVRAIWQALPGVFDRIGVLAINGLVTTMETGLAGITEAVNAVLTLGGRRPDWAIPAPRTSRSGKAPFRRLCNWAHEPLKPTVGPLQTIRKFLSKLLLPCPQSTVNLENIFCQIDTNHHIRYFAVLSVTWLSTP